MLEVMLLLIIVLPIFLLIKSDIKLDKEQPVTVSNWLGTNLMLFTGIGLIYLFVVIFFMKKIHPSKRNYLKAIFIIAIIFIVTIALMIVTGNIDGAKH